MPETVISELSPERKARIKKIVKLKYGFWPKDSDIAWIDDVLRNHYNVFHDQRIILELAAHSLLEPLLKHRDRVGSRAFEEIWLSKSIFRYLTYANMCFRTGVPAGTIPLCRTAIESGLRERLAEEIASEEAPSASDLPSMVIDKIRFLQDWPLASLINALEDRRIITRDDIEHQFKSLKLGDQTARRVLDKFIHGDVVWMVDLASHRQEDTTVIGAKDVLDEFKIVTEMYVSKVAFEVLRGSYRIAEIICFIR